MPIFSNRSIARMLGEIAPTLGTTRAHDLKRRIMTGGRDAIAAEWEIAAIYCLAQEGKIRVNQSRRGVRDLDLIYASHQTAGEVAIEITAISDESFNDRNPIYPFNDEVQRLARKNQLQNIGGVFTRIGHVKDTQGPILGIPLRKDFSTFFRSAGVRDFFSRIKAAPSEEHKFRFTERGAASVLVYQPGRLGGGGGHRSHTGVSDPTRNPIAARLEAKERQIRKAGLELPTIVIICDADCSALNARRGTGTVKVEDVVDLFFSGRRRIGHRQSVNQIEPRPKSRRINAVVLWSLHQALNTMSRGPNSRSVNAQAIVSTGDTYYDVSQNVVREVAGTARYLPPIANMPVNAMRKWDRPVFYGGWSISEGSEFALSVKLSLLGVQKVLAREIALDEFAADHADVFAEIKRVVAQGAMLSDVRIEHVRDRDDDWLELVFDAAAPERLFDKKESDGS